MKSYKWLGTNWNAVASFWFVGVEGYLNCIFFVQLKVCWFFFLLNTYLVKGDNKTFSLLKVRKYVFNKNCNGMTLGIQ
jgi:hypothetical protein